MAKPLRPKRGTTAQNDAFTGLESEITIDKEKHSIRVHDNVTAGGHEILPKAKNDELYAPKDLDVGVKTVNNETPDANGNVNIASRNVGDEWVSYTGVIPEGGVPYCGQEVNRSTYADLWAWAQSNGLVKTESEWQAISSSQNGNVAFYSSGNGSSTFRMPKIIGYIRGANSQTEAGSHVHEGLPNISGEFNTYWKSASPLWTSGNPFSTASNGAGNTSAYTDAFNNDSIKFDASRANTIYGNSSHVTPDTSVVLFGVFAFGKVVNAGELDATTLASEIASVKTSYLPLTGGTISGDLNFHNFRFVESAERGNLDLMGDSWGEEAAGLAIRTANAAESAGTFMLTTAKVNGRNADLVGWPDGRLTWKQREVERVEDFGGTGTTTWVRFVSGLAIVKSYVTASSSGTTVNFPFPFAFNPTVLCQAAGHSIGTGYTNVSTTSVKITSSSSGGAHVNYVVIGFTTNPNA